MIFVNGGSAIAVAPSCKAGLIVLTGFAQPMSKRRSQVELAQYEYGRGWRLRQQYFRHQRLANGVVFISRLSILRRRTSNV